jgi:SPP1 family predicted phage head-tail adaptor
MPGTVKPAIDAGKLDKRVTLLSPVYNEPEDEIVSWSPEAEVWAAIHPSFAQEINQAGRTVATTLLPIVIRYRTDIDARWRIQDRDRTYQVKGITDIARRRVQLQLACEEVR